MACMLQPCGASVKCESHSLFSSTPWPLPSNTQIKAHLRQTNTAFFLKTSINKGRSLRRNSIVVSRLVSHSFSRSIKLKPWQSLPGLGKFQRQRKKIITRFEEGQEELSNGADQCDKMENDERPPFDLDLAVLLAGFAFESYNTPPEKVGVHEKDAGDGETTYLTKDFVREIYDGQLFVKLKKGVHFPGLDLWGTSDPYIVLRIGACEAQSHTIWATKDPVWNEDFKLNVKYPATQFLQVAAWDANILTSHRRLGNSSLTLESFSDGRKHEVELELEGMGGGGIVQLEVQYRSFSELDSEQVWWHLPFLTELFQVKGLKGAFKTVFGTEGIRAGDFVRSALGSIQFLDQEKASTAPTNSADSQDRVEKPQDRNSSFLPGQTFQGGVKPATGQSAFEERGSNIRNILGNIQSDQKAELEVRESDGQNSRSISLSEATTKSSEGFGIERAKPKNTNGGPVQEGEGDKEGDYISSVIKAVSLVLGSLGVDTADVPSIDWAIWQTNQEATKKLGYESQNRAEAEYIESGLALRNEQDESTSTRDPLEVLGPSTEDLKQASQNLLKYTEEFLGSLAMVATAFARSQKAEGAEGSVKTGIPKDLATPEEPNKKTNSKDKVLEALEREGSDDQERDVTRQMFQTAESAVEAWAVLATSLGGQSFVKSEFEKICFINNKRTDTQVCIWRDVGRRRLVVAFRGTEQTKWKDLSTDLNVIPVGFNPERVASNFKEEVMVHSGFVTAYDSVKQRLLSLLQASMVVRENDDAEVSSWHVYLTGHSLGGALATLFALELSSSKLVKTGLTKLTMYNFGSPRVGNKLFADMYNQKVKDSWRVVNHRDIIPTVPRLMGYCHVAQPIYLVAGASNDPFDLLQDGYHGDIIGEITPDLVFEEFMRGERQLLERLLQTEIAMVRAIRDGSALMQHMEDFYYIALLERVEHRVSRWQK